MTPPVQIHCIVCSAGSFRPFSDWVNKFNTNLGPLVACDGHTKEEIQEHFKRLKITLVGNGPAPTKPTNGPTQTQTKK